jgi:tetratricopeptide (TPR) repeat protein
MSTVSDANVAPPLAGKRVAFVGKLGGMTRREAQALVREQGGTPVDAQKSDADLVVIGAEQLPLGEHDDPLDASLREAAAEGRLEIITETQLWQRLGLVESEQHVRRLYTPAMLADLLDVSVATIRRWHRRGLIVPSREVHRLPYFDFQEVSTAQRIAQLVAAGASPAAIEKKLEELARFVPDVERPLAQLSVIVEGKQILLRQGEGLIEPGGQLRIDFEALERPEAEAQESTSPPTVSFEAALGLQVELASPEELLEFAIAAEEEGRIEYAAELLRAVLAAEGPLADICFQLAELLYRLGDLGAARERYYMAIELDEEFVEARNNLGCVLLEEGQSELAAAAFQGALACHADYPDAHYHLARTLDELDRPGEAEHHWQQFLRLAPNSPWADEARDRLGASSELAET